MRRVLIIIANCALLFFLLIGLPAATRNQVGDVQLSHASTNRLLLFWTLGLAAGANVLSALFLLKDRKLKKLCWEWTAVFGALLLAFYGFTRGWFNFRWLRHVLEWMQNHL